MDEFKEKVSCDPGWNDPPLFSYDSRSETKTKKSNVLTKRIAFPMQANAPSIDAAKMPVPIDPTLPPQPCDLANLPPPPSIAVASKEMTNATNKGEEICDFNEEEALSQVLKNFNEILDNRLDNVELQKKSIEIRKRIDMLKKLWEEKKFSALMQQKILKLSEAMKSDDGQTADDLQRGLMVDHACLCSSWMSGVRHMLHALSTNTTSDDTISEVQ